MNYYSIHFHVQKVMIAMIVSEKNKHQDVDLLPINVNVFCITFEIGHTFDASCQVLRNTWMHL